MSTQPFKITTDGYRKFDRALEANGYRLSLIDDGRDIHISEWIRAEKMVVVGRIDGEITSIKADMDDGFIGDFIGKHVRSADMISAVEAIYRNTVLAE